MQAAIKAFDDDFGPQLQAPDPHERVRIDE
jgi:hypothetical protein